MNHAFDKFQAGLEKMLNPVVNVVSNNKSIKALTKGFVFTVPLQMGVVLITILVNLPIGVFQTFLTNTGLAQMGMDFTAVTISMLAIYTLLGISYTYMDAEGENGLIGAIISLGSFLALMPLQSVEIDGAAASVLKTTYLGSNGIFVAMLCALLIPKFYCFLMKKNLKISLPDSVPPMVSDSLAPTFVAIILFTTVFAVKFLFHLTPWGNVFDFITDVVAKPVLLVGTSPWACILIFAFCNMLWFFGIHPSSISGLYLSLVFIPAHMANMQAYQNGEALPYLLMEIVFIAIYIGGNGNTLGLCLAMFFAKSEKYKALRKIVVIPNIFNINEPLVFGIPLMLNPIYFIPLVTTSIVAGSVSILLYHILPVHFNPVMMLTWVTPGFVSTFLQGGFGLLLIWIIALIVDFLIYLPFFKIDDSKAYAEEQAAAAQAE